MDIEDVEIGGLVLLNGKVVRVLSIHSCNGIIERINQIPVFNFKPWTPTLDDQGRIVWPGGDCPLLEGEEAYVWFKNGPHWDEEQCKTWWDHSKSEEHSASKLDWSGTGERLITPTHFIPLGKAAERLLGSVESSEIVAGDWVSPIDAEKNCPYAINFANPRKISEVRIDTDGDHKLDHFYFDNLEGSYWRSRFQLFATAAEHQTYLDTEVPEGYEKLPFDDGGWGVPVEGDSWVNTVTGDIVECLSHRPNMGKRVIVRNIETPSELKIGRVGIAASWSPTLLGHQVMAIGKESVAQGAIVHGLPECGTNNTVEVDENYVIFNHEGEDMSVKTNEELLKEAPEQIGYERSVGVPRTGRFKKDLFYSPIDGKILKGDFVNQARNEGRRVIYRKKKSKLRKTFDVATFIPRWSLANTWKPALGATFLLGATTCAVGCAAHFLGYQFDPSVLVESARSAVEGLNQ